METRAHHVLIGIFTLAVAALAMVFVLWIGRSALDREFDEYDVLFEEAVTGLTVGGAVQYNGIQIGEVRKLSLAPDHPSQVIAHVRLVAGTPVKTDTRAKLTLTGLTGVAIIQLSGGSAAAASLQAKPGQDFPVILSEPSALQKLLTSGEDIIIGVNDVLLRLSALLQEKNLDRVAATLENLEQISSAVAERSEGIGTAIADISEASRALRKTLAHTEQLVIRLERVAGRVETLIDGEARELMSSAEGTLDALQRLADNANGIALENRDAIANFTNQGLAQLGPTLAELRVALTNLRRVIDRLEANPADYLLGRDAPKEYDAR